MARDPPEAHASLLSSKMPETASAGMAPMLAISLQLQFGMFWQVQMTLQSFIYAFLLHSG